MRKFIFTFPLLFLVGACTSVEFVRKDTAPRRQAVVRYSPPSSNEREVKYKQEVDKKAREFCASEYEILREYQARDEARTTAGVGTGFGFAPRSSIYVSGANQATTMYNFVEFACK